MPPSHNIFSLHYYSLISHSHVISVRYCHCRFTTLLSSSSHESPPPLWCSVLMVPLCMPCHSNLIRTALRKVLQILIRHWSHPGAFFGAFTGPLPEALRASMAGFHIGLSSMCAPQIIRGEKPSQHYPPGACDISTHTAQTAMTAQTAQTAMLSSCCVHDV